MDYAARLHNLRLLLQEASFEALLIEQPTNLFYLTGLELSAGVLVISPSNACLIVDGRYFQRASQQNLYPTLLLEKNSLQDWLTDCSIHSLGFYSTQAISR
jgi:Xaa-Pro aminopeptidase